MNIKTHGAAFHSPALTTESVLPRRRLCSDCATPIRTRFFRFRWWDANTIQAIVMTNDTAKGAKMATRMRSKYVNDATQHGIFVCAKKSMENNAEMERMPFSAEGTTKQYASAPYHRWLVTFARFSMIRTVSDVDTTFRWAVFTNVWTVWMARFCNP